jgi:hypothetical protein
MEDLYDDEVLFFNDVQLKIILCHSCMNDKIFFVKQNS